MPIAITAWAADARPRISDMSCISNWPVDQFADQSQVDQRMIALDGTITKSRLGANAILAVSVAFARAHALYRRIPLYQHFADMLDSPIRALPRLTINLFSGGKHAGQQVSIQDVLIIPMSCTKRR